MPTRKELIVEKYCILEKELLNFLDHDILPDIEDVEVSDIVFIITYQFLGIETNKQYENKIVEMIKLNNLEVSDTNLKSVVPLITSFVQWLNNCRKKYLDNL